MCSYLEPGPPVPPPKTDTCCFLVDISIMALTASGLPNNELIKGRVYILVAMPSGVLCRCTAPIVILRRRRGLAQRNYWNRVSPPDRASATPLARRAKVKTLSLTRRPTPSLCPRLLQLPPQAHHCNFAIDG